MRDCRVFVFNTYNVLLSYIPLDIQQLNHTSDVNRTVLSFFLLNMVIYVDKKKNTRMAKSYKRALG